MGNASRIFSVLAMCVKWTRPAGRRRGNQRIGGGFASQVGLQGDTAYFGCQTLGRLRGGVVVDRHLGPFGGESPDDGGADPAGATGVHRPPQGVI